LGAEKKKDAEEKLKAQGPSLPFQGSIWKGSLISPVPQDACEKGKKAGKNEKKPMTEIGGVMSFIHNRQVSRRGGAT